MKRTSDMNLSNSAIGIIGICIRRVTIMKTMTTVVVAS